MRLVPKCQFERHCFLRFPATGHGVHFSLDKRNYSYIYIRIRFFEMVNILKGIDQERSTFFLRR